MKKFLLLPTILILIISANNADASWSFDFSYVGSNQVDLNFITDEGPVEVWNYALAISYSDNLNITGYSTYLPDGFFSMNSATHDTETNMIFNISGMTFSSPLIENNFTVASFTFEMLSITPQDGIDDIFFDFSNPDFGGLIEGSDISSNTYNGNRMASEGHLTQSSSLDFGLPVPTPSALVLLGLGLCFILKLQKNCSK